MVTEYTTRSPETSEVESSDIRLYMVYIIICQKCKNEFWGTEVSRPEDYFTEDDPRFKQ